MNFVVIIISLNRDALSALALIARFSLVSMAFIDIHNGAIAGLALERPMTKAIPAGSARLQGSYWAAQYGKLILHIIETEHLHHHRFTIRKWSMPDGRSNTPYYVSQNNLLSVPWRTELHGHQGSPWQRGQCLGSGCFNPEREQTKPGFVPKINLLYVR